VAGLGGRRDEAAFDGAKTGKPLELAAHLLERLQAIAQPGGVLEAACLGKLCEPPAHARSASAGRPSSSACSARAASCARRRERIGPSAVGCADATTPSPRLRSHT